MVENNTEEVEVAQEVEDAEDEKPSNICELPYGYEDGNGVLHKEAEFREIKGKDEEAISEGRVRNNVGKIVTTLLADCTVRIGDYTQESMKRNEWQEIFKDLFIGDRDALLLKISEYTFGKEIEFENRCPICKDELVISFNIDELKWDEVPGDPHHIEFELPKGYKDSNGDIHKHGVLSMPTGFEQEMLDKQVRKNPGRGNTMLITRCVNELGTTEVNASVVRELSKADRTHITDVMSENVFGPEFLVNTICSSCGSDFEAGVNPVNFIL